MVPNSKPNPSSSTKSFFDDFPGFVPDESASISVNFASLAAYRKWTNGSKTYRRNWNKCVEMEFDKEYGTNYTRLESWQKLCTEVGIERLPSIKQCKKALAKVNVNIVDLMDCRRSGDKVRLFPSLGALQKYTKAKGKFFPREKAKEEGFVRVLLKYIL